MSCAPPRVPQVQSCFLTLAADVVHHVCAFVCEQALVLSNREPAHAEGGERGTAQLA